MSSKVKKVIGLAAVGFGIFLSVISFGVAWPAASKMILAGLALWSSTKKLKPATSGSFGTEIQLSGDPIGVREIIYGEAWTGGTLRYRNSSGIDNRDFYMVIVLAGHECDSVPVVLADKETLTLDGSGNVTAPSKWAGIMNVRFYLGTDSQTADATLDTQFTNWTTNHRLRGLTYAIVKLTFNEESLNTVPAFRFKVRGRKVYDPRLDSTNGGSGSHRLATPSTWQWSENAVLCLNDYDRGIMVNAFRIAGVGIPTTRFDWANVIAEANVCDENVALAAGGNENRYTVNGIIDPRQDHRTVRAMFEAAFAGDAPWSDNKWRYFAGAYRTPTLSLLPQHFVGPLKHTVHRGEADRYDTAHGRYASGAEYGNLVGYDPVKLSTATPGSERVISMDFQLVNDKNDAGTYDGGARAQRLAKLLLEKAAAGKTITCTTNLYGYRAIPGETIQITHAAFGLSAQTMRVLESQLRVVDAGLVCDLTLEAGPSSLYTWAAEETAIGAAPTLPQQPPLALKADAMLVEDPFFNRRAEMPTYTPGTAFPGYYWAKSAINGGAVSIDLDGGSAANKGALLLSINNTFGSRCSVNSLPTANQLITRGEQAVLSFRMRRTSAVPAAPLHISIQGGRGTADGTVVELGAPEYFPSLLNADLAALTLNQWYDFAGVLRMGNVAIADSNPAADFAVVGIALVTDTSNAAFSCEFDSIVVKRTASQEHVGMILKPMTVGEDAASIVPADHTYDPGDPGRYGGDYTGATDSSAAIHAAIASGHTVRISAGTLRADTLDDTVIDTSVKIVGEPGAVIDGNGTGFFDFSNQGGTIAIIRIEGVEMRDMGGHALRCFDPQTPAGPFTTIERFELINSKIVDSVSGVYFTCKVNSALVTGNDVRNLSSAGTGVYGVFFGGNFYKDDEFVDANVNTTTDRITLTGHVFVNADAVRLNNTGGTLPAPIAEGTTYYVKKIDANTIELYTDVGLTTIVNITSAAGGGTHAIYAVDTAHIDSMEQYVVTGNTFDGLDSGSTECHAVILYGRAAVVTGNIVKNVTGASGDEGIYTKCKWTTIADNVLVDAGGGEGMITVKSNARIPTTSNNSPFGYDVNVKGNVLVQTSATEVCTGVYIQSSEVNVEGNIFEGLRGRAVETQNSLEQDNIRIKGNLIVDHRGDYGIYCRHWGYTCEIEDNTILRFRSRSSFSDVMMISLEGVANAGPWTHWSIKNNKLIDNGYCEATTYLRCLNVVPNTGNTAESMVIEGNVLRNKQPSITEIGLNLSTGTFTKLTVKDNNTEQVDGSNQFTNFGTISSAQFKGNTFIAPWDSAGTTTLTLAQINAVITNRTAGGSSRTYTLPVAIPGAEFHFIRADSGAMTVDPNGTEQIRGTTGAGATVSLGTSGILLLRCEVTGFWEVIGAYSVTFN